MSVPKHWILGGWYHRGLIVHQQRYRSSDSNKNVDIKFSGHEVFLLFKTLIGGGGSIERHWKPKTVHLGGRMLRIWFLCVRLHLNFTKYSSWSSDVYIYMHIHSLFFSIINNKRYWYKWNKIIKRRNVII